MTIAAYSADDHSRDLLRILGRGEQRGRGPDVWRDDVWPAQAGLGDEPVQEPAHRPRREKLVAALGGAEAWQVDGEQARVPRSREDQIGTNAYTLSDQGLVSNTVRSCGPLLSA
jgi:hypothetical protein